VPEIVAIFGFMPPTLPDLILAVAGGIFSVAWFNLLKARLAKRPDGLYDRPGGWS
jgi:hypothetical protein